MKEQTMAVVPGDIADKAESIRNRLESTVKAVKADADLTPEGQHRKIDEAHQSAKSQMDELRVGWKATKEKNAESAVREVFGAPHASGADAISVRDAEDRASSLETANEARDLMARAKRNGDTTLERAIAREAYQRNNDQLGGHHWAQILDDYIADRPVAAKKLQALRDNSPGSFESEFSNTLMFSLPARDWL